MGTGSGSSTGGDDFFEKKGGAKTFLKIKIKVIFVGSSDSGPVCSLAYDRCVITVFKADFGRKWKGANNCFQKNKGGEDFFTQIIAITW